VEGSLQSVRAIPGGSVDDSTMLLSVDMNVSAAVCRSIWW
jgi:hypothetical protein